MKKRIFLVSGRTNAAEWVIQRWKNVVTELTRLGYDVITNDDIIEESANAESEIDKNLVGITMVEISIADLVVVPDNPDRVGALQIMEAVLLEKPLVFLIQKDANPTDLLIFSHLLKWYRKPGFEPDFKSYTAENEQDIGGIVKVIVEQIEKLPADQQQSLLLSTEDQDEPKRHTSGRKTIAVRAYGALRFFLCLFLGSYGKIDT